MIFLQRDNDHTADVKFTGDRARIVKDGKVVVDWTTGGVIADVPQGGGYSLQVQSGGRVTSTPLAIGAVVATAGQSNMNFWYWAPSPLPAAPDTYILSGTRWIAPNAQGSRVFSAILAEQLGCPVALVNGAVGGTALLQVPRNPRWWLDTAEGSMYDTLLDKLALVGGRAEYLLWAQGEFEAMANSVTEDSYAAALQQFLERAQADIGAKRIGMVEVGIHNDPAPSPGFALVRAAQHRVAAAMEDVLIGAGSLGSHGSAGLDQIDTVHYTQASYGFMAAQMARALLAAEGLPTGAATLDGTDAADHLVAGDGAHLIAGLEGDDVILGGAGNDVIDGGIGNDIIDGGAGDNLVRGDAGDDAIVVGAGNDLVSGGLGADNVHGGGGRDELWGDGGNDALFGEDGDDQLVGGAGDDLLDGGSGTDRLVGGLGDDVYVVDSLADLIVEDAGVAGGSDTILSAIDFDLTALAGIEHLTLTGAAVSATGNALDNRLTGTALANTLTGGAGNDTLDGGAGGDLMIGGGGDDVYFVDDAADRVRELYGEGKDEVIASVSFSLVGQFIETLTLVGTADLTATGNSQANTLIGNDGANRLDGGGAIDRMMGGKGNDSYVVDHVGDKVVELAGEGDDTIHASVSYDLVGRYVETLVLTGSVAINATGNSQANTLIGNAGANRLDGGAGADTLEGGAGQDVLIGGAGSDRFLFGAAPGEADRDSIVDFDPVFDTIGLDDAVFAAAGPLGRLAASAFRVGSAAASAADRILSDPATGSLSYDADGTGAQAAIIFASVTPGLALTNADFIIY